MNEPRPFDFNNEELFEKEMLRFFNEMESYLRTDKFLSQGTDSAGRRYVWEAFQKLKKHAEETQ